jgi:predicted PurR-regulated permease PerM
VIIAILIGAQLLGILGALLVIPAAATVQSVVRDYWRFYQGEFKADAEPAGETG